MIGISVSVMVECKVLILIYNDRLADLAWLCKPASKGLRHR